MTWEILSGLIILVGFIITIVKCVLPLNKNITELNCNVTNLVERIKELVNANDKQDQKIEDHEIRITKLENK